MWKPILETNRLLALVSLLTLALIWPNTARAQDSYRGDQNRERSWDTVTCSSYGDRVFCDADTRDGVRLFRQFGRGACAEGSTWGYTERGIWVDRGCQAEFSLRARARLEIIDAGTFVSVRTIDPIHADRYENQIYNATVDQDVRSEDGRLAIPRGSPVQLAVRTAPDNDLILDLESVTVNGQRYTIDSETERIESQRRDGIGANRRTGEHIGGGAALGAIIGAIAGGGKGAAIGAAAGAAAGAGTEVLTRGRYVQVPSESVLTFRIERPLTVRE